MLVYGYFLKLFILPGAVKIGLDEKLRHAEKPHKDDNKRDAALQARDSEAVAHDGALRVNADGGHKKPDGRGDEALYETVAGDADYDRNAKDGDHEILNRTELHCELCHLRRTDEKHNDAEYTADD